MSTQEIRSAIAELPTDELASLGEWMDEYRPAAWDRQIAQDVDAGRFDALAEQANREFEAGRCRPL